MSGAGRLVLLAAGVLAFSLVITVGLGLGALRMSTRDAALLALFLALSGVTSLAVGLGGIAFAPRLGLGRLRMRLGFAHLLVLLVAFFNVLVTAQLMFISPHDLGLLGLLLLFSAAISLCLAAVISSTVVGAAHGLVAAAQRMAAGHFETRVEPAGGSELEELAEAFNAMAAMLQAADVTRRELEQARRDMMAAISHDLRTPLASLRAMLEAINDGVVTDQATVERYVHTALGEVGRLSGLIDDLFQLSRLDSGELELTLGAGSILDVLSGALESMLPQARAKGVALDGQVAADLPAVQLDERLILRVLDNLIGNAVRHTPTGGRIRLAAEDVADAVRVDVTDSGEGIPAGDLPHIFDRFYRGDQSRARGGGAGLGLAIARGIVKAHGGRIWAQTPPDGGARFSFTLQKAGGRPSDAL